MIRNLFGYPVILAITVYLGILNQQSWVILLFFAELILFLVQIIAVIYQKMHLFLEVTLPQPTLSGEEQAVTVILLKNIGVLPVQKMMIQTKYQCFMGNKKKRGKRRKQIINVWGKVDSEDTQSYEIQSGPFPSGQFLISVPYIRLYDYFGIFSVKIQVKRSQIITILPNFIIMPIILFGREVPIENESDNAKKGQDPTEIYDIREYQAGDSLKQIYWKRSAGREALLYRENAAQKGVAAILFFQFLSQEKPILFHYKLKIAGSFMLSLLQRGYLHFLVWENIEEHCLERRLIENEQNLYEAIMEFLSAAAQKGKKKRKQEKNDSTWQESMRLQYEMQFEEVCPEAFFLRSKNGEKKDALILEQETEVCMEFLKGKKLTGTKQEEQKLEEEMRKL